MEYISGHVHESFQKIHALEILSDFVVPILIKRWNESNLVDDNSTESLPLYKGDIILVRFFKPSDYTAYTYIESVITKEGEFQVSRESTLSREFVSYNTTNGVLFHSVTKQYERDMKINSILDESL